MNQARIFEYIKLNKKLPEVLVLQDDVECSEVSDLLKYFKIEHIVFPDFRASVGDDLRAYGDELKLLQNALYTYYNAKTKPLVITPYKTMYHKLPKESLLEIVNLEFAGTIKLQEFKEKLIAWGYSFVDIVEVEGEVSFRGDIIDIFVNGASDAIRISLFDEEIEQIKAFDVETQRTKDLEFDSFDVKPAFFSFKDDEFDQIVKDVENSDFDAFVKDVNSLGFWYLGDNSYNFLDAKTALLSRNFIDQIEDEYELSSFALALENITSLDIIDENNDYKDLSTTSVTTLLDVHKNKDIEIIAINDASIKAVGIYDTTAYKIIYSGEIVNVISDKHMLISLNKSVKKRKKRRSKILLDDLKPGDYVVHEDYGLGIFKKIDQAKILGGVKDFIVIEYVGDDKILLPVENLDYIDRYIASSGSLPVLDRLGKGSFTKLKEKVKKRLLEIASVIVNTAASRALIKAPIIKYDKKLMKEFQEKAGFTYTDDQATSIDDILKNLSSGLIMDRLLSGDVGFGKTEVAMSALYSTVKSGFQGALIVPTTLLSSQHFKSLKERDGFEDLKIAKLDRFITPKEKKSILSGLKDGSIDIVIGTHSLFGAEYKNIGLVIIDEEHKFGVKQKEKLKEVYETTHLLSMSATPIPRSLNQALSSIKTMSVLMTPPSERLGVRTLVKDYNDSLLKEVILRELRRGGQVFYVFNSIKAMDIKESQLLDILPNLRILKLHSKVTAAQAEKELMRFDNKEYDVLLATSIIESGIHMPNVNTMIVDGADRFGIADLHQLRGRVGRGHTEGFAYFLVTNKENITDEAKKRLVALESNSFLGSGSVLAHHDLEIRGGGNLLGDSQSGHIKNIGYSLYLRMLEDSIKELSNTKESQKAKVDIKLMISAYISDEVVSEDRLRLELYRRLSHCESAVEVYDIEEECIERFGSLDIYTKQFFELIVIKLLGLEKNIKTISNYGMNISVEYINGSKESFKSASKDDDDIIKAVLDYLRNSKPKVL